MKKPISYIYSFILILIISSFIISSGLSRLYNSNYEGQSGGKINDLIKNHQNINILAIGDSRCAHHIIPDVLGHSNYNLSHNGMSLIFHTGLIDQLINYEKISIDTILLNLGLNEVHYLNKKNFLDINQLKYFYNENEWITNKINSSNFKERYKYLLPIYKWNGKIISLIANKYFKKTYSKNGYVPTLSNNRDSINVLWRLNKTERNYYKNKDLIINKQCVEYLLHIKNICLKNNVALICFFSPTYNLHKIPVSNKKSIIDFFKQENIILLDYSNGFHDDERFQNIWVWSDVFHLNEKGARILSNKVRKDLNKLKSSSLFK